jgi:aspartyl-tRNA(Asn)/glutamyl-tRNA(Gln) amidotransferase subunit C
MAIERTEVERIAELARLHIPAERVDRVAAELSAVLDFVEALRRLDLVGRDPGVFAPADAPLREDVPDGRRLGPERATAMAPASEDGFFLVPPIVEHLEP